jgi:uncharacterized protein YacL
MLTIILCITLASLVLSGYAFWQILPKKSRKSGKILLDTSAIMDGRINEIVKSGFVPSELLVPRFVIAELQLLADKSDHLKRERARFGLQVIQDLQDSRFVTVSIISDDIKSEKGVDEKLVKLALKTNALLFTTDFNLLKVAEIEGVRVLNINELAQNLRPTRIPGERATIKIVGKGQERNQGVGYLEDGTLVVVENGAKSQGKAIDVEFTRNLQTTAGRMMFAKHLAPKESVQPQKPARSSEKPQQRPARRPRRPQTAEDKLIAAIDSK